MYIPIASDTLLWYNVSVEKKEGKIMAKIMANEERYLNLTTGEIVIRKSRRSAYLYFKADGKRVGYKVKLRDIIPYNDVATNPVGRRKPQLR